MRIVSEVERPTARTVKDALMRRYCGADLAGQQYVCIEEARSGAGFDGNAGSCDLLAINTYKGRGMQLIGHEVKVSMADWKKELAEPEKAERFARYCRRWYVAVPSSLAVKIKDEVPPAWGLLSLSDKGRLTETVKAPARKPDSVPEWWWVAWLAQFDRQAKRQVPQMLDAAMAAERLQLKERVERDVASRRQFEEERNAKLRENAERLRTAIGIDLQHLWGHNLERLGHAWALVQAGYDVDGLVRTLRRTADALDGIRTTEASAS